MGLFRQTLREVEQSGETDVRLTLVLNNLADLYLNQKKYAQSLNTLATLCRDQGHYGEAEAFIKRCL